MFKRKYYVNNIESNNIKIKDLEYNDKQRIIGLYRNGFWKGEGHCCGWYNSEYMYGTVLLGYFVINSSRPIEKGEIHLKEIKLNRPKWYRKLQINSIYTQYEFFAKNDKEAFDLFFTEQWGKIPIKL